jgi:hypothetical protein
MALENLWNDITGLRRTPTKICASVTILFTTNPTRIFLALEPDIHRDIPAANRLSHGTAAPVSKFIFQYIIKTSNKTRKPWK